MFGDISRPKNRAAQAALMNLTSRSPSLERLRPKSTLFPLAVRRGGANTKIQ
jgi:hypothetical protein